MSEIRRAKGMRQLTEYRKGNASLSPMQSILAKCAECCGDYADGNVDCKIPGCPLYPYMPYGTAKRKKREMSEEHRAKLSAAAKVHLRRRTE